MKNKTLEIFEMEITKQLISQILKEEFKKIFSIHCI